MPTDLRTRLAADLDGAFEELVKAHQHGVYTTALRLAPTRADAEEVAQEAFIRAYKALRRYPSEQVATLALRPWLASITVNLCRNAARDRARRPQQAALHDGVHPPTVDATDGVGWGHLLDGLPDRARAALVLRHVQGLPYAEVAEVLGVPVGTVKSDVHRALATLAKENR